MLLHAAETGEPLMPDATPTRAPIERDTLAFNYDALTLTEDDRGIVIEHAKDILKFTQRAAADIIEIGRRLLDVKALLPHGMFGDWLHVEFGTTVRTAQMLMNVARTFKNETVSLLP